QAARGAVTIEQVQSALGRIKPADATAQVGAADMVIEAATENEEVKKTIFKSLTSHLSPTTILASNTSSISITRLA
ncbi:3-hydroxyacyl-CoA dehydrogenase NAD-binding domain-containing protein, partial [Klebsiella aerogenes]|uniref:3-hydroxyacyl-CoA dehydrogenase NAD-binding domain-containing protein n=1 Tax=Klebsiella aerogenes TaxID=548 RepID=UPI002231A297